MRKLIVLMGVMAMTLPAAADVMGPLRPCAENPRYFAGPDGRPLVLVGSHTWPSLQDMGPTDPPSHFDYDAYLEWLTALGHNFIRLWHWELSQYQHGNEPVYYCQPLPWPRTGPGMALDGKPKFDLSKFDDAYFDRLRQRVVAARDHKLYVSIMLFEGYGIQLTLPPWRWDGHPFAAANNINGLDGNPEGEERGIGIQTLGLPEVMKVQEAYVRKVIDTVNDLDNVLYEITNESGPYSTGWQYHMIRFIHRYERTKPYRHPVGMTYQHLGGSNQTLFDSPAEWISPNPEGGYTSNPPPGDGSKVVIPDTDHLWGIGGDYVWAWKSFMRGLNPIFMDPYSEVFRGNEQNREQWEGIRRALGHIRRLSLRLNLATCVPRGELSSTGYCLADPGEQYAAYAPDGGAVTIDLQEAPGRYAVEWLDPLAGKSARADAVAGGSKVTLAPPGDGMRVVVLRGGK